MYRQSELKGRVRALRLAGKSVRDIAKGLNISKSTASRWTADMNLAESGLQRLWEKQQLKLFDSNNPNAKKMTTTLNASKTAFLNESYTLVSQISFTTNEKKVFCALLYWTHGAKTTNYVSFTESDPSTVLAFLKLLREGFPVVSAKFRCMLYLNENQSELETRKFWSDMTGISLGQFTKSYRRIHTMGRDAKWGNFRLNYYDVNLARELRAIYQAFSLRLVQ